MAAVATVEAWVRAQTKNYDQDCAGFTYTLARLFGTVSKAYGSAKIAYAASTIDGTDMNAAPAGAVGYWQVAEPNWHVMVSLGNGLWLGATKHLTTFWGVNTGTVSSADYIRLSGAVRSKGWSLKYGADTIQISASGFAGVGTPVALTPPVSPPPPTSLGDNTMILFEDGGPTGTVETGQIHWATDTGNTGLVDLTKFPIASSVRPILTKAFGQILLFSTADLVSVLSIYAAAKTGATVAASPIDYAALAKAVNDDAAKRMSA